VEHRKLGNGDALGLSAQSGGSQIAPALLTTGLMSDVSKMTNFGAEAAFSASSFLVQGQYAKTHLNRDFFDANLSAWYAQASYVVTGEDYEYSKSTGAVSGVNVRRKGGAIEVAARISGIDLKDTNFLAGEGRTYTVGANYYFRRNIRVMADFAHSKAEDVGLTLNDRKVDVVAGRLQVAF
jgi:phosphate-selective porin OprO/OprP